MAHNDQVIDRKYLAGRNDPNDADTESRSSDSEDELGLRGRDTINFEGTKSQADWSRRAVGGPEGGSWHDYMLDDYPMEGVDAVYRSERLYAGIAAGRPVEKPVRGVGMAPREAPQDAATRGSDEDKLGAAMGGLKLGASASTRGEDGEKEKAAARDRSPVRTSTPWSGPSRAGLGATPAGAEDKENVSRHPDQSRGSRQSVGTSVWTRPSPIEALIPTQGQQTAGREPPVERSRWIWPAGSSPDRLQGGRSRSGDRWENPMPTINEYTPPTRPNTPVAGALRSGSVGPVRHFSWGGAQGQEEMEESMAGGVDYGHYGGGDPRERDSGFADYFGTGRVSRGPPNPGWGSRMSRPAYRGTPRMGVRARMWPSPERGYPVQERASGFRVPDRESYQMSDDWRGGIRRKEMAVPRYDGTGDLGDFLVQFEAAAAWNRFTEEEKGMRLACSLGGEARSCLSVLEADQQWDYETLKEVLESHFEPAGAAATSMVELWTRRCKEGESAVAYGNSMRKLVKKAYPGEKVGESILIGLFIKGLRSVDLRRAVHLSKPRTLTEAITYAHTYESWDGQSKTAKPKPGVNAVGAHAGAPQPAVPEKRPPFQRPPGEILCWHCGESGHLRFRCSKLSEEERQAAYQLYQETRQRRQAAAARGVGQPVTPSAPANGQVNGQQQPLN